MRPHIKKLRLSLILMERCRRIKLLQLPLLLLTKLKPRSIELGSNQLVKSMRNKIL